MHFKSKLKCSGILTTFLFIWFYGTLVTLPIVDGQYETPHNYCGGVFRSYNNFIDLTFNREVIGNNQQNMVCVWTIIPSAMFSSFDIFVESVSLNSDDKLSFTTFNENDGQGVASTATQTSVGPRHMEGNILVVILVSPKPSLYNHFRLNWTRPDDSVRVPHIRYVTTYNSYGKDSVNPLPYFAWGFLGNSLSTFAFPRGNDTEGFTFQMIFERLELDSKFCNQGPGFFCDMLMICKISDSGTISKFVTYDKDTDENDIAPIQSEFGLFLIMWGGNYFNGSGGGSMQLTYSSVNLNVEQILLK